MSQSILHDTQMSRRDALRSLSLVVFAIASSPAMSSCGDAQQRPSHSGGLAALLARPESAAEVGAAFLAAYPEASKIEDLAAQLGLDLDSIPAPGSRELQTLAKSIRRHHVDDFRNDRWLEVEGWLLTRTELGLAGLLHLSRSEG